MVAVDGADPLVTVLDELAALCGGRERDAIGDLRGRLSGQRLRVLVAGEAKRGKSTLVNALLGRAVLPTGVTPLTALPTTVRYGTEERVTALVGGEHARDFPLRALEDLVTERGNPGNAQNLSSVTVSVDAPLLARGVELVDTPGTGSVYGHNTAQAQTALKAMDAAVFVVTADPPASAAESELMAQVAKLSVAMFVVLNKADRLTGAELAEVREFTARVVSQAAGKPVRVYPLSARGALAPGGDAGFDGFARDFTAYLDRERAADLRRSVAAHAERLAGSLRDEVVLARRAVEMRDAQAAAGVTEFAARLAAVRDRRRDAADLAAAESRRMLADLNEAAERAGRLSVEHVRARLTDMLDGDMLTSPAAQIEHDGHAKLAGLAVAQAESFRREWAQTLEARLAVVADRLTEVLRAELQAVRQAAADLLGLTLTKSSPDRYLAPDLRFFYQAGEQAGQTELLAGVIRRHLPGAAGRSRARRHLLSQVTELVPQQVGRARADLQYRLAEATRRLARDIDARYQEGTGRLEEALADADSLRDATAEEVAAHDARLAGRLAAIDRVRSLLRPAGSPAAALGDAPGAPAQVAVAEPGPAGPAR